MSIFYAYILNPFKKTVTTIVTANHIHLNQSFFFETVILSHADNHMIKY